jgi:hypothetical protein
LDNSNERRDREKVSDHMRDKYTKRDIKLKHNSINITTYRARHNELVVPIDPAPQEGQWMVVDTAPNPMEKFEWLLPWRCTLPDS